jgi:hypothetical protein
MTPHRLGKVDAAMRMHQVQFDRANRLEAERDAALAAVGRVRVACDAYGFDHFPYRGGSGVPSPDRAVLVADVLAALTPLAAVLGRAT